MEIYKDKKDCCGCGSCMNICPKNAINMKEDEYGYIYPSVDNTLCICCGACLKSCVFQNKEILNTPLETYAAVTANTNINNSASGGIFASIAKSVILDEGIVFGASMEYVNGKLTPMHIGINKVNELIRLQGSKYVQSYIGSIYKDVEEQLASERVVLFSGTPCQVAGLKSYLKRDYENLLLIDIICHGVPSARFFRDYVKLLEKKIGNKIIDFKFRDKTMGWGRLGKVIYQKANGDSSYKMIYSQESSYYKLFLDSDIYRESCYQCKYACHDRVGDITIGDYWGIHIEHPELLTINNGALDQSEGVSCLITNTEKGKAYIERYSNGLRLFVSTFEKASRANSQLNVPCHESLNRVKILELYKDCGYDGVERWFMKNTGIKIYIIKLKNRIPKGVKKWIKSLCK